MSYSYDNYKDSPEDTQTKEKTPRKQGDDTHQRQ